MRQILLFFLCGVLLLPCAYAQQFQWVRTMGSTITDFAYAAEAAPTSGAIYTTGQFTSGADFDPGPGVFTLPAGNSVFMHKLNAAGNFVWAKGIASSNAWGSDIVLDAAENIYICGTYFTTNDFDPGPGTYALTQPFSPTWCAFVAKYDSAGNFIWAKGLNTTNSNGWVDCTSIALDAAGNVIVAGGFNRTADFDPGAGTVILSTGTSFDDPYVCKLSPLGDLLWVRAFGTVEAESSRGVGVDAAGNIYHLADYYAVSSMDLQLEKYDPAGNLQWRRLIGGPGNDFSRALEVDPAGNCFLTGYFSGTTNFNPSGSASLTSAGGSDGFVLKYNNAGGFVWARRIGGTGTDEFYGITLDASNNLIFDGTFQGTVDFDPGSGAYNMTAMTAPTAVVKTDTSGNFIAAYQFSAGASGVGDAGLAANVPGAVIFAGGANTGHDFDPGPAVVTAPISGNPDIYVLKLSNCPNPTPPANTTPPADLSICAGGTATLSATGMGTVSWFASASGGVALGTGGSFITPALGATTTFYAQDSVCVGSARTAITVTVRQPSAHTLLADTCGSYGLNGQTYTSSGTYVQHLINAQGCDSALTLQLTIRQPSTSTITATACGPYVFNGQTYTNSGTYVQVLTNAQGCDSTLTLQLSMGQASASTISPTACDSYTSPSGLHLWSVSGTYLDTMPNAAGCDSVITVQLTVQSFNLGVQLTGHTLTALESNASYQWIYCDSAAIPGQTSASFSPQENGHYAVILSQNGCTDTSACTEVVVVGIIPGSEEAITLYPNPTTGTVTLHTDGMGIDAGVLRNVLGQEVGRWQWENGNDCRLEIPGPAGVYWIALELSDGRRLTLRVIKE